MVERVASCVVVAIAIALAAKQLLPNLLGNVECDWFNLKQVNIDCFLAKVVLSIVGHNFELESNNEPVLCIFEELLGKVCLLHVVIVEEQVLPVYVRYYESIVLPFVEELESASDLEFQGFTFVVVGSLVVRSRDQHRLREVRRRS